MLGTGSLPGWPPGGLVGEVGVVGSGSGFLVTVTFTVAVLPLKVFAVIVAVPALLAVILPFLFTDAIFLFELDQVMVLFSASSGAMVASTVFDWPTSSSIVSGETVTLSGLMISIIVNSIVAVLSLRDLTVMVVVPGDLAVTLPVRPTVATDGFDEV